MTQLEDDCREIGVLRDPLLVFDTEEEFILLFVDALQRDQIELLVHRLYLGAARLW